MRRRAAIFLSAAGLIAPAAARSNPYLPWAGEAPVTVYAATCATSGGYVHFYAALDYNLFGKYGITVKTDLYDNTFAENLEKSGFLKGSFRLWSG